MKSLSKLALYLLFTTVFVCKISLVNAQVLNTGLFEPEYSKEVLKAKKKGNFVPLGYFGESNGDKFYRIAAYKPKKAESYTVLVHTFDLEGKEVATTSFPMAESKQEVEKLNLASVKLHDKTTLGELNEITDKYQNKEVAMIKNPTLAGKPTIEKGRLRPVYKTIGDSQILERFEFVLSDEQGIDERFWNSVAFPLNNKDLVIGKTDYLTNKRQIDMNLLQTVGEIFYDANRSAMLPAQELVYVGGVKATNALKTFISGTMNLQSGEWKSKYEIETSDKIGGRNHNAILLPEGNIAIQLTLFDAAKDQSGFIMLLVDETGKEIRQQKISFETSTGKKMRAQEPFLMPIDDGYLNFATVVTNLQTKPHFAFSKTVGGKEVVNKVYSIEQLAESAILPPKMKFKAKKIQGYKTNKIEEKDGRFLVTGLIGLSNGFYDYNSVLEVSMDGEVLGMYLYPITNYPDMDIKELPITIEGAKNVNELSLKVNGRHKEPDFVKVKDGVYYVINGMTFNPLDKGVDYDATLLSEGILTRTYEVNYYRIDYDRTFVGVTKIDFTNKTISNTVVPAAVINGDYPGIVLNNGALFLDSDTKLVIVK
jgi:hypothetical protein